MKRVLAFTVVVVALLSAAPAFAAVTSAPVSAAGVTPDEMAQLMSQYGWPAHIAKGADGGPIINSRIAGVKFDVRFFECQSGRCRDIQFAVGWSNAQPPTVTLDKVNAWNGSHRFLRTYLTPDHALWAVMDARIARGSTANVEENLVLWQAMLREFKPYFRL